MNIDWTGVALAGVAATVLMTLLMYMAKAMGMKMNVPRMLGLMSALPERTGTDYLTGGMAHLMVGVLLAGVYELLFGWLGWPADAGGGMVIGVGHGVLAGVSMARMPAMHPCMGPERMLAPRGSSGRTTET